MIARSVWFQFCIQPIVTEGHRKTHFALRQVNRSTQSGKAATVSKSVRARLKKPFVTGQAISHRIRSRM